MTWLAHVLTVLACRSGGVIIADDPALAPLAAMRRDVAWRGPTAIWMASGLAAGGAVAWRTTSLAEMAAVSRNHDQILICVDSPVCRAHVAQETLRPDLLLSHAPLDGLTTVSPHAPGLFADPANTGLTEHLSGVADALVAGRIAEAEVLSDCWQGHAGARASRSAGAGVTLSFDPLRWLRGLDEKTALGLALAGQVVLARGGIWRLRVPVLSEGVVDAELRFVGEPPFGPPSVSPVGAGGAVTATQDLTQDGATVRLTGQTRDPWLEVDVSGARLVLSELSLRLPGLGPVAAADALDPLSAYGSDPLDAYDPGARG